MQLFVEKLLFPIFAGLIILLAATNPMGFDTTQRISGTIAILALAYFLAHTVLTRSTKNAVQPNPGNITAPQTSPAVESLPHAAPRKAASPRVPRPRRHDNLTAASPNVSAPNGIAIGGNNLGSAVVNNYAPPKRHLSEQQIKGLLEVSELLPESQSIIVQAANTSECIQYADEISSTLKRAKAGPRVKGTLIALSGFPSNPQGTIVCIRDEQDATMPMAGQLANTLVGNGKIDFTRCTGVKNNEILIIIAEQ